MGYGYSYTTTNDDGQVTGVIINSDTPLDIKDDNSTGKSDLSSQNSVFSKENAVSIIGAIGDGFGELAELAEKGDVKGLANAISGLKILDWKLGGISDAVDLANAITSDNPYNEIPKALAKMFGSTAGAAIATSGGLALVGRVAVGIGIGLNPVSIGLAGFALAFGGALFGENFMGQFYDAVKDTLHNVPDINDIYDMMIDDHNGGISEDMADWLRDFGDNIADYLGDGTINVSIYDPLVLDLDGDGVSVGDGAVYFDHNGDGVGFAGAWIGAGDGLLARDIDGDGRISSGAELFGNYTLGADGMSASDGFSALALLDSDANGVIDGNEILKCA